MTILKYILTAVFVLFLTASLLPQNRAFTDSLRNKIAGSTPQEKIFIYAQLAWEFKNNNADSAIFYAQNAVTLSERIDDVGYIVMSINALALTFLYTGKEELALPNFRKVLKMTQEHNLMPDLAHTHVNIGNFYFRTSNYDSALYYYSRANELFKNDNSPRNQAVSQTNIGIIKYETGSYGDALDHYYSALKLYAATKNKSGLAALHINIGNVYIDMRNFEKAFSSYYDAVLISKEQNDNRRLCVSYRMLGRTHLALGEYNKAKNYQYKALELAKILRDNYEQSKCLLEIGKVFHYTERLDSAKYYLNISQGLAENHEDLSAEINFYLGSIYSLKNNNENAIKHYSIALTKARSITANNVMIDTYEKLSELYNQKGDLQLAIFYAYKHLHLKDSIINSNIFTVIKSQEKYEAEKSEKERSIYEMNILRQEKLIENQKKGNYMYMILGIILSLIIIGSYLYYQSKQKSLKMLHIMKEEVNQQKILTLIKEQEVKTIKSKFEGQENERKRLAKELHDGIGGTLASLKLLLSKNDNSQDKILIKKIDEAYNEVRTVSRHLIPPVLLNNSFTELLKKYLDDVQSAHKIKVHFEYYPEEEINAIFDEVKTDIYRVIQELVSNVLKHANASKIDVQLIKHKDYINLMVADDGNGFEEISKSYGIGLINIKSRIELLKGNFEINSTLGSGTLINMDIPYQSLLKRSI